MHAFAAGIQSSLATVALAAREVGRPIIQLSAIKSAQFHQRQEWAADMGCDKWPTVRGVWFAQDHRGFERIPVFVARPRASSARHGLEYVEPGVLLGVGAC